MGPRTFSYLHYKIQGHSDEDIHRQTGLGIQEIELMEKALRSLLQEIEAEKPKAKTIGEEFVRLTRYIYAAKTDQKCGITRPDAIAGGACMIGAYLDEAMNKALRIDGVEEFVIYIAAVGKK